MSVASSRRFVPWLIAGVESDAQVALVIGATIVANVGCFVLVGMAFEKLSSFSRIVRWLGTAGVYLLVFLLVTWVAGFFI